MIPTHAVSRGRPRIASGPGVNALPNGVEGKPATTTGYIASAQRHAQDAKRRLIYGINITSHSF